MPTKLVIGGLSVSVFTARETARSNANTARLTFRAAAA